MISSAAPRYSWTSYDIPGCTQPSPAILKYPQPPSNILDPIRFCRRHLPCRYLIITVQKIQYATLRSLYFFRRQCQSNRSGCVGLFLQNALENTWRRHQVHSSPPIPAQRCVSPRNQRWHALGHCFRLLRYSGDLPPAINAGMP